MYPGANLNTQGCCHFKVWSPYASTMELKIMAEDEHLISMQKDQNALWSIELENILPETRYKFVIDGEKSRPDPASFFQPDGVHGPSQIINHNSFHWEDQDWKGVSQKDLIIYELHTGTFTPDGTFLSAVERLDNLIDLGITAIEIMPISQFPGKRNWGYDGVYPYAPANAYGRPDELKTLIAECHKRNMAVILDVVYNHFGPEGNYLNDFGPYFTDKYKTPWGPAINFDEAYSDQVREYFINNALYWLDIYHVDGLRLDAVHQIYDLSASHILSDLNKAVITLSETDGRLRVIIAESDLNDKKVVTEFNTGGYNCSAQWSDDFHHALHSLLTNEKTGYYSDFGTPDDLMKALKNTFVYNGIYSSYRCRKHGNDASDLSGDKFVIFTQNHDQVGNRAFGERLSNLVPQEALKLAAALLLLSPYIPLIFMGEEYGETSPFLYFVEHGDADLISAVRNGRKQEFAAFKWNGEIPDPQSEETFLRSKLNWDFTTEDDKKVLRDFYKKLITLRKEIPALNNLLKFDMEIDFDNESGVMSIRRSVSGSSVIILLNFDRKKKEYSLDGLEGKWKKIIDSSDPFLPEDNFNPEDSCRISLRKYNVVVLEREEL